MSIEHYENFPVASILLPARLRPAVEVIYHFARSADDLADEGNFTNDNRLAALAAYEIALDGIEKQQSPNSKLFRDLAAVISNHKLPLQPFRDLLSAFKQDVVTVRYSSFEKLMDYCMRSANPVGRLMLELYEAANIRNQKNADAICSALQLINFWQDVAIDWKKGRIYLPQEDLDRFGVTAKHIEHSMVDEAWKALMQFQIARARAMLLSGAPLALRLPGRLGFELRLVVQGGLRILERIEQVNYDVFRHRPTLGKADFPVLAWRALRMATQSMPAALAF